MLKDSSQYSLVHDAFDDDDDGKPFGDPEGFGASAAEPRPKSCILHLWPWLSDGVLICTSMFFFILWMRTPSAPLHDDIPVYSPASGAVESILVRFNGTLNFPSIYRGPPSPEIDAAWARIAHNVLPTRMTLEEMTKAGEVDLLSKVKYPKSTGGGFMVSMESPHQLHCLNLLRKSSWLEYYGPTDPSFQDAPEVVRMHLDHCIEMIRQTIMCNADVTMITWDWVQGHKIPYPNFNTRHQCRDYEKILDWASMHAVHIDKSEVGRFEDTVDLPYYPII
ncbi:hypothetical protein DEU56DRAFT_915576 [Suillus clintonianus]|uniref:uncharacterized protein n=1 Tax=Suillus clintonianus TaxID=1904413 RepID=UPI001B8722DD|nr:uncharacterized protein DEU56DRAFT_915576 [Suillus clintonianus]KAG2127965.1 hypothetical protein DEU56DRAFT_915576 [Suillus clintonianus]